MAGSPDEDPRRRIPPVDEILGRPAFRRLMEVYGRRAVTIQTGECLAELRGRLAEAINDGDHGGDGDDGRTGAADGILAAGLAGLADQVAGRLEERFGTPLSRVVNATGVFLHTNLGRAPLAAEVAAELPALLDASLDLEIDLATGRRSDRNRRVGRLLSEITGAEAAVATNNGAGALVLVLSALASGREVIVSRGELVEIGGSFRIPDMMTAAGARLVEVGTTNRTRLADYDRAIRDDTALLLKIFPSNYRVEGFVASVKPAELARLGAERGLPVVVDEGSGLLEPHRSPPAPQLADHPSFRELLAAGCDLVLGSGDKLLGGAQAGLLAGRSELVERCRRHPLYRPLRPDRTAFAVLEAVLRRHLAGRPRPLDRLWPDPDDHRRRLESVVSRLPAAARAEVIAAEAFVGGGSAPERPIPGEAIGLALPGAVAERLLVTLRRGRPPEVTPVVGYLKDDRLVLDLRTVAPEDDDVLVAAVDSAVGAAVEETADR